MARDWAGSSTRMTRAFISIVLDNPRSAWTTPPVLTAIPSCQASFSTSRKYGEREPPRCTYTRTGTIELRHASIEYVVAWLSPAFRPAQEVIGVFTEPAALRA